MWYKVESMVSPIMIDSLSSKKWVYIRRNVVSKTEVDEFGNEHVTYRYEEQKIPKENYAIFLTSSENSDRLSDIEDILADMIGGGF